MASVRRRPYDRKLKVGAGRAEGYRFASADEVEQLRRGGDVLYENERYGNRYVVDRPGLEAIVSAGRVPIVHMGQVEGVRALVRSMPLRWLSVLLWCPREVAEQRLHERGATNVAERLRAWDETAADLAGRKPRDFQLCLDTSELAPAEAVDVLLGRLVPAATP